MLTPEPDTEIGFSQTLAALDVALREHARLWHELSEGKYELLYHRKPTQRDLEIETRRLMRSELPEILRWRLAYLAGGPLPHE